MTEPAIATPLVPSVEARRLYNHLAPFMPDGHLSPDDSMNIALERAEAGYEDGPAVRELVREGWLAMDDHGIYNALIVR